MNNLRKGDMVIIKEDNLPPMKWPLGRILNVFAGDDGAVRVADVKTSTGVYKRAIQKLAPLFPEEHSELSTDQTTQGDIGSSRQEEDGKDTIPRKRMKIANCPIMLSVILALLLMPVVYPKY